MRELFDEDGEVALDPNGFWQKDPSGIKVYRWWCQQKRHSYLNPEFADKCCQAFEGKCRRLEGKWIEVPLLFD